MSLRPLHFLGLTLLIFSEPASAGVWVFEPAAAGSSVQDVADNAADGDTLVFKPGRHEVRLFLTGKSLVLLGEGGPDQVILTRVSGQSGPDPGMVGITGNATSGLAFRARGLTFEGGLSQGYRWPGALRLEGVADVTIEECRFIGNSAEASILRNRTNSGGALAVTGASSIRLTGCLFQRNRSTADYHDDSEGGAATLAASSIHIDECQFDGNIAGGGFCGGRGGALLVRGGGVSITGCTFTGNKAQNGSAISASGIVAMERCVIRNSGDGGGSIWGPCNEGDGNVVRLSGSVSVRRCLFMDNAVPGPALQLLGDGVHEIVESTFLRNGVSGNPDPAVRLFDSKSRMTSFKRNLIAFNHGPGIGDDLASGISCNIIWGNHPNFTGSASWNDLNDNRVLDPLLCDEAADGVLVAADSPCLEGGFGHPSNCGIIGSVVAGCPASPVRTATWSRIKTLAP